MTTRKLAVILVLVMVLSVLASACSSKKSSSTPPPPTTASSVAAKPSTTTSSPAAKPSTSAPPSSTAAQKVTLKYIAYFADTPPSNIAYRMLISKVNEKSKGALTIVFAGGPESFPATEAATAISKGSIDMGDVLNSMLGGMIPGLATINYQEISYEKFRATALSYIQGLLAGKNLYFIGHAKPVVPMTSSTMHVNKAVTKPEDVSGLKLAAPSPALFPFYQALGATAQTVALTEYFTAIERKVVDGYTLSTENLPSFGLDKVTKTSIDHPFMTSPSSTLINLSTWNKLSKELQDIIVQSAMEVEKEYPAIFKKAVEDAQVKMKASGMQIIKYSAADEKKWYDTFREATWAAEIKRAPEVATKMKELMTAK
ncbi:MAG: TRAP transporter substrate-binding protein DctP [Chloroflexi bacterium]|nr:TRAP transporter substrate-binding protein DctP [Chloroflexota bacterium]